MVIEKNDAWRKKVVIFFSPENPIHWWGRRWAGLLHGEWYRSCSDRRKLEGSQLQKKMRRVIHTYSYRLDQDKIFKLFEKLCVAGESQLTNIFFRWLQTPNNLTWHKCCMTWWNGMWLDSWYFQKWLGGFTLIHPVMETAWSSRIRQMWHITNSHAWSWFRISCRMVTIL